MRHTNFVRRATSLGIAAASGLLGCLLFAPSAFAGVVEPVGDGSSSAVALHTAPTAAHNMVTGGMAGWQITLIAVGAALLAATVAVFMDRARTRTAHQGLSLPAA
jgi:hypothetical protein